MQKRLLFKIDYICKIPPCVLEGGGGEAWSFLAYSLIYLSLITMANKFTHRFFVPYLLDPDETIIIFLDFVALLTIFLEPVDRIFPLCLIQLWTYLATA